MKKDFFVSYNKTDKKWAKWVAGTLEERGYSVYLQAWDIAAGDDFIEKMNLFLENSSNYIAILSNDFWKSKYCSKEFTTAFNSHLKKEIDKFLSIRVDETALPALYSTTVYIDLFDIDEEQAVKKLMDAVNHTENPRNKGVFPKKVVRDNQKFKIDKLSFPGLPTTNYDYSNTLREIILLEKSSNESGDLFNRLIFDVFHSLGFDKPNYNIQKSGREIDMILTHRTENRIAIVESKATKAKVGGASINKFVGLLDVEKASYEGKSVVGYYVSKSGFTSTALEQEQIRTSIRKNSEHSSELVLLGPQEIVKELIHGNVLCTLEQAVDAVNISRKKNLHICAYKDLLVSKYGWIWILYYSTHPNQVATHFAFVHADGKQLLDNIGRAIVQSAKAQKADFTKLTYINNDDEDNKGVIEAKNAYFDYIEKELGDIQFEGMPADKEAGAIKVNLENIYVPLLLENKSIENEHNEYNTQVSKGQSISTVLSESPRTAILAKPGGGKSTLIRRIALAYAYPERRMRVNDDLPDEDWFPIYIRCRDLGSDATKSISEIIFSLTQRAEIICHKESFRTLVEQTLQNGRLLLLIDGLDEISSEKHRIGFVSQLRTFIATYPTIRLVLTSRETGFRAVARTIESYCNQYSIINLNENQIKELSFNWHNAVIDDVSKARDETNKVCQIILGDTRILSLAQNPLLLTTLLFVKRWVGYLPTKKRQLYEEMIKLLLVTWNAVAHDKLDLDETEPQLAFVAHYMSLKGQKKIIRSDLEKCIIEARKTLPDILGYTNVSPSQFIDRVEERSSLLIQLGLEENEQGEMVPSYEFSHLSFQEYLTAKAIVEEWLPEDEKNSLLETVKLHLGEEQWMEVIPLAATLSGRSAKPTIEYLIQQSMGEVNEYENARDDINDVAATILANCVICEVPMNQDLLSDVLEIVVKKLREIGRLSAWNKKYYFMAERKDIIVNILKSKYGETLCKHVKEFIFENLDFSYIYEYTEAWIMISLERIGEVSLDTIYSLLKGDYQNQVTGALLMMDYVYNGKTNNSITDMDLQPIFTELIGMLKSNDNLKIYVTSWCTAWSGFAENNIIPKNLISTFGKILLPLWMNCVEISKLKRMISWAMASICTSDITLCDIDGLQEAIEDRYNHPENDFDLVSALIVAYSTKTWSKELIKVKAEEVLYNKQSVGYLRIRESKLLTQECDISVD